jgi:hypothetical protein
MYWIYDVAVQGIPDVDFPDASSNQLSFGMLCRRVRMRMVCNLCVS